MFCFCVSLKLIFTLKNSSKMRFQLQRSPDEFFVSSVIFLLTRKKMMDPITKTWENFINYVAQ